MSNTDYGYALDKEVYPLSNEAAATSGTTLGITVEADAEYTISYDLNVPEGEEAQPNPTEYAQQTVRFGEDTPLPEGDEPTLDGYTFLGWTDMPNGGKTYGSAQADWDTWGKSEKWDKLEGATLYAQWDSNEAQISARDISSYREWTLSTISTDPSTGETSTLGTHKLGWLHITTAETPWGTSLQKFFYITPAPVAVPKPSPQAEYAGYTFKGYVMQLSSGEFIAHDNGDLFLAVDATGKPTFNENNAVGFIWKDGRYPVNLVAIWEQGGSSLPTRSVTARSTDPSTGETSTLGTYTLTYGRVSVNQPIILFSLSPSPVAVPAPSSQAISAGYVFKGYRTADSSGDNGSWLAVDANGVPRFNPDKYAQM